MILNDKEKDDFESKVTTKVNEAFKEASIALRKRLNDGKPVDLSLLIYSGDIPTPESIGATLGEEDSLDREKYSITKGAIKKHIEKEIAKVFGYDADSHVFQNLFFHACKLADEAEADSDKSKWANIYNSFAKLNDLYLDIKIALDEDSKK
jgi:hypothetical protein